LCPVVPKQEWGEMDGIGTVGGTFGRIGPDGNRSWGIGARTHVGETRYTMGRAGWRCGRIMEQGRDQSTDRWVPSALNFNSGVIFTPILQHIYREISCIAHL